MKQNSGIYLVKLKNLEPLSVNAQDKRRSESAIKVTSKNCKVGKAKDFEIRRQNYVTTFGIENVEFIELVHSVHIDELEKVILNDLSKFRIRGPTNRLNEWLEGISPEEVVRKIQIILETSRIDYRWVYNEAP